MMFSCAATRPPLFISAIGRLPSGHRRPKMLVETLVSASVALLKMLRAGLT